MELIKLNRSANILSGNPMPLAYYVSPWSDTLRNGNVYIMLSASAEIAPGSDSYMEVYAQQLMTGNDGAVEIDLHSIINSALQYHLPDLAIKEISPAAGQLKKFKITATLYNNNAPVTSNTSYVTAMKAGAGMVAFNPEYFSIEGANTWFTNKKPLAFILTPEIVHPDDVFFLFFLKRAAQATLHPFYKIYYELAGTYADVSGWLADAVPADSQDGIYCLPAGFKQAGLDALVPAGATAIAYELSIYVNGSQTIIDPVRYELEQRTVYNGKQLLYRNSLGGLTTLRLYGQTEVLGEYTSDQVERIMPPSYIIDNAIRAQLAQSNMQETQGYKSNTGWLRRDEAERLRDFLLSPQRFEVVNGKLVPIKLNTTKITFYSTDDGLISATLEWSRAVINRFYTPDNMPAVTGCPAVKTMEVRQLTANQLLVLWSFPFGHNKGAFTVSFPGETAQEFPLQGNSGNEIVNITLPASVPDTATLIITGYIVCNPYSTPEQTGPVYNATLDWKQAAAIIAADDNFAYPFDALPYTIPVTVLANDSDPGGGTLEVSPDETFAPGGGPDTFTYKITSNGTVTVKSWGPDGTKTFTYQVRKVGATAWEQATVILKKSGSGETENFIYAKMNYRNVVDFGNARTADVYIETFKDAACTQALNVSNLRLNYTETYRSTYGAPIVTNKSVVLNNANSVRIYSGFVYENHGRGNSSTSFELTPSADYVKS